MTSTAEFGNDLTFRATEKLQFESVREGHDV
jgi:hypothetical protein